MITNCQPDPERLAVVKEAMETYGMTGGDPDWPWNVLSTRTVAYTCGAMCRDGETVPHNHNETEFARCRQLAGEAVAIVGDIEVGFGSEASYTFSPFYVVASVGEPTPQALTPETVRTFFGGTIFPAAEITVDPLTREAAWWKQMVEDFESDWEDEAEFQPIVKRWEALMDWFKAQPDLHDALLVMIGDSPLSDENGGSVFPRMAVALTTAGSMVGIYGHTVHT